MRRSIFALPFVVLPMFHCAEEADVADVASLPADAAGVPMDLRYDHVLFRGQTTTITVSGAPANKPVYLLLGTDTVAAGACPAFLAPDCLEVAAPFRTFGPVRSDAAGVATFRLPVPANLAIAAAEVQAATIDAGVHYISDARILDVMDGPTATTIPALRTTPAAQGSFAKVSGVVTAVRSNGFALQTTGNQNAALWVYTSSLSEPMMGDVVEAAGMYTLFDNNSTDPAATGPNDTLNELDVANQAGGYWIKTGTAQLPAPVALSLATLADPMLAEPYEGMLVRLQAGAAPLVVDSDPAAAGAFREFFVTDGSVRGEIDNEFFDLATALPTLSIGDSFTSVTGILFGSFDENKVAPRDANDAAGYVDVP